MGLVTVFQGGLLKIPKSDAKKPRHIHFSSPSNHHIVFIEQNLKLNLSSIYLLKFNFSEHMSDKIHSIFCLIFNCLLTQYLLKTAYGSKKSDEILVWIQSKASKINLSKMTLI